MLMIRFMAMARGIKKYNAEWRVTVERMGGLTLTTTAKR
jgi:hypothetical protein